MLGMEPQGVNTPQNTDMQPSQTPNQQAVFNKAKKPVLLIIVLFLLLAGMAGGTFYANTQLQSKDKELDSAKQELSSIKGELSETQKKLEALDSPEKKARDVKRKNDLAKFVATLSEYAANHNGKYPSTEPSFFAKDFEKVYITGKLSDFVDPNTKKPYTFTPVAPVQTPPGVTLGNIQYQWPSKCAGTEFEDVTNERQAATRLILESGEIYCLDV